MMDKRQHVSFVTKQNTWHRTAPIGFLLPPMPWKSHQWLCWYMGWHCATRHWLSRSICPTRHKRRDTTSPPTLYKPRSVKQDPNSPRNRHTEDARPAIQYYAFCVDHMDVGWRDRTSDGSQTREWSGGWQKAARRRWGLPIGCAYTNIQKETVILPIHRAAKYQAANSGTGPLTAQRQSGETLWWRYGHTTYRHQTKPQEDEKITDAKGRAADTAIVKCPEIES
jgi:hypothetical protein